jgi:hypothetical protein
VPTKTLQGGQADRYEYCHVLILGSFVRKETFNIVTAKFLKKKYFEKMIPNLNPPKIAKTQVLPSKLSKKHPLKRLFVDIYSM